MWEKLCYPIKIFVGSVVFDIVDNFEKIVSKTILVIS